MKKEHHYASTLSWVGENEEGTSSYTSYERSFLISSYKKPIIEGSSDPAFRGDATKYNPEELFLFSLSSCHMLWYLHLCSEAGVVVTGYTDEGRGIMVEEENGSGHFSSVKLYPQVVVKKRSMVEKAKALHAKAHKFCFIANSCNFPITPEAEVWSEEDQGSKFRDYIF